MSIGQQIRSRREERGLTLVGLAHEVGVQPGTVWRWEAGQNFPRSEEAWRSLAAALGTTVGDLFGEHDDHGTASAAGAGQSQETAA